MPTEPSLLALPDGRVLAFDDVGDPTGRPLVYLHGSPDCRLGRHPDDDIAARLGVRLLAVDRPGSGRSSPDPARTYASFADDITRLADHLELATFSVLAWSAGAIFALACGALQPERIRAIGIVAGLVPIEAYDDPEVLAAAPEGHRLFAEMAREMEPSELAASLVVHLLPHPLGLPLAREVVLENADPVRRAELDGVPGAVEQLARAKVEAVRQGLGGMARDLECQAMPSGIDLAAVSGRVRLWYGDADPITPPAFGRWFAAHLTGTDDVDLEVIAGAGHTLILPRWATILSALTPA